MEEKIIMQSEKPNKAMKRNKILALVFLLVTIVLSVVTIKIENTRVVYRDTWYSLSWADEEYDFYADKYDMAYTKLIISIVCLGISLICCISFGIIYFVLNNAKIIITNKRIIGSTSYGDKFNYPLENVKHAKLTGDKIEIYGKFHTTNNAPLKLNHITNYYKILHTLNNRKGYRDYAQEQIALEDVRKYENVDNSTKKEDTLIITAGGLVLLTIIISIVALFWSCTSSSSSRYEDNLDSGMDKFINGDYDSATDEEKDAVDDFLDWQSEQD